MMSFGRCDLVKRIKLVLLWFKESLLALNQEETELSSVLKVSNREVRFGLEWKIVVSSAKRVKLRIEEEKWRSLM